MSSSLFPHGELYAPYFLFIRGAGKYADADLLRRFGLTAYRPTRHPERFGRYVVLADDGQWTMVADDWYYTLWHSQVTRSALADLGRTCDVFACSVGDCDRSFEVLYYRD